MKKEDSKIFVRILAIVLAVLMVVGIAYLTVYMIVDRVKEKKKDSAARFGYGRLNRLRGFCVIL